MENKIKVIAYYAGQEPVVEEIDNTLGAMQKFVGGYIQAYPLTDELLIICNEEGKISGKMLNRRVISIHNPLQVLDIICGDFFVCRTAGEDFASVMEGDLQVCKNGQIS